MQTLGSGVQLHSHEQSVLHNESTGGASIRGPYPSVKVCLSLHPRGSIPACSVAPMACAEWHGSRWICMVDLSIALVLS